MSVARRAAGAEEGILGWWADACARFATRPAIEWRGRTLSYAELDRRATAVANAILDAAGTDSPKVGVLLEDRVETVAALIGILRADAVFVPLDVDAPDERLRRILTDASPEIALSDAPEARIERLRGNRSRTRWIAPADDGPEPRGGTGRALASIDEVDPDALRYVVYTSGSTGRPKGIAGRLRPLSHFVRWEIDTLGVAPGWRTSQLVTPSFDAYFRDVLVPLCAGATLCLPPEAPARLDPAAFGDWIEREKIALVHCVPSLFSALLAPEAESRRFESLRWVLLAGEVLHVAAVRRFVERFGGHARIVNLYGATETTMVKCFHVVGAADLSRDFIPVGTAIPGSQALVLDERGARCPAGVPGEIYIRSPDLSLGYFRDPQATAAAFVPDPFGRDPAARMYRTGDSGMLLEDGALRFLGRRDEQLKIHGVRVEPAEVEAVLLRHPAVSRCAVRMLDRPTAKTRLIAKRGLHEVTADGGDRRRLIAWYVATEGIAEAVLREHVGKELPASLVPARFVRVPALPLRTNGKLDTDRLPAPGAERPEGSAAGTPPRTASERVVAEVFRDLLEVEPIGVEDDFFLLGGDSLGAIALLHRLSHETGRAIPIDDLFERPTVMALAARLDESRGDEPAASSPPDPAPRPGDRLPLTDAQRGVWYLSQLNPGSLDYVAQGLVRLRGPLDPVLLSKAWRALLERHEALRARYGSEAGIPYQTFVVAEEESFETEPLESLAPDAQQAAIHAAARGELADPFDLERGPLVRAKLFRLAPEEHTLLLTLHEIAIDLWSVRVLLRDLGELYEGLRCGREATLAPLRPSFGEFVAREAKRGARPAREEAYWKARLSGELPVLELPLDRPRPRQSTFHGESRPALLDADVTARLRELARGERATLFALLLGVLDVWLRAHTGQEDLIVGAPLAQRGRRGSEGLVGFFLNMLPLRLDLSDDPTFRELLGRARDVVTGALGNSDYPFARVLEWARASRDPSLTPVFQVMLNMLSFPDAATHHGALDLSYEVLESGFTKYDLSVYAQEHDDRLYLQISYRTELFDRETIDRMMARLVRLLREVAAEPDRAISSYEVRTPEEVRAVVAWNDTARDFELHDDLVTQFRRQATRTPAAPAFLLDGRTLTYAELSTRVHRLARRLRGAGVGPEVLVGVCADRSFDMVTALLAVLEAGGAWVALDPEYPERRLDEMLADTAPRLLLVEDGFDRFPGFAGVKIRIGEDPSRAADDVPALFPASASPDRLLNVVYTSASTGRPRGTAITVGAVTNRLAWMWQAHPFREGDVALFHKSFALVAATWEIFGALLRGIPTVIASTAERRDPARLWPRLVEQRVSHVLASPPLLEGLLEEAERHPGEGSLRLATTSAEPITPELALRWRRRFPEAPLLNLYGSTECSSNVTVYDTRDLAADATRVPIGTPLPNCRTYVLDGRRHPVPIGVTGELYVAGACLAREYWARPESTAERFLPDPFSSQPDARLYRTGDLARQRPDGRLEILGRRDQQVKIRGFRVELEEIEAVLGSHPGIARIAVVAAEDRRGKRLIAWFVARTSPAPTSRELREWLRERLPDFMVPSAFVAAPDLPRTAAGKIDRASLSALPAPTSTANGAAPNAPRDPIERRLADIWERLLECAPVGTTDDFFDLGGHSLLGVRLFAEIEKRTGTRLPLASLLSAPTIREQAELLRAGNACAGRSSVVPIQPEGGLPPLFCVHAHEGNAVFYRDLARHLGPDQPLFGLQARGVDGDEVPLTRVEDMAAHYLSEIRAIHPEGPYHLAGYCFGGRIAFEMARQLEAAGERVAFLGLVDSYTAAFVRALRRSLGVRHRLARLAHQIDLHGSNLILLPPGARRDYFAARLRKLADRVTVRTGAGLAPHRRRLLEAMREATRAYDPEPYGGRITLFRAHKQPFGYPRDPRMGWGPLAAAVEVHEIPGHYGVLLSEPRVGVLADTLRECLRRLRSEITRKNDAACGAPAISATNDRRGDDRWNEFAPIRRGAPPTAP